MHIIDIKALSAMFKSDTEKIQLVVNGLIQRIPEWQTEVQTCAETNNHEDTRKLCHRIRGAAGCIKADKLTESATHLGDIIKTNQFDKLQASFADLNHCLSEILTFASNLRLEK